MPGPIAMSPKTQAFEGAIGQGADEGTQAFEQGFSQMAYQTLLAKLPDVVQDVVTFKILNSDLETGSATGAFVVNRHGESLYIPVVLADNQIKPMDVVYNKKLNIFLPLDNRWLNELDKISIDEMGHGVKTPETLYTDVDIRNLVVPPITGRFSYASEDFAIFTPENLEKKANATELRFIDFLTKAPNMVKTAFSNTIQKNTKLLKKFAEVYGIDEITTALIPHKEAALQLSGGALWIADKDTKPSEFERVFGDKSPEAYAGVKLKGYHAKDNRKGKNLAVQEQPYSWVEEPSAPGVYCIYFVDGKEKAAVVIPNPIDVCCDNNTRYSRNSQHKGYVMNPYQAHKNWRPEEPATHSTAYHYLAVFENGDYAQCNKLVGARVIADEFSGSLYKRVFGDSAGDPRNGLGFFIRTKGTTIQATKPVKILSITTDSEGCRRIKTESGSWSSDNQTLVTDPRSPVSEIVNPRGAPVVYLPKDYIWVPLKEEVKENELHRSIYTFSDWVANAMGSMGVHKMSVKNASHGQFSVDGAKPVDKISAIKKLAVDFVLDVEDAAELIKKAETEYHVQAWIASPAQLAQLQLQMNKRAAEEKKDSGGDKAKKPPKQNSKPGDPSKGQDQQADQDMAVQQAMMEQQMQQQAAQPSPSDLAAMELQQQLEHEMQKIQEKMQLVQQLAQRSQEIAGGAPPMPTVQTQAMGAPPPSTNMATGQPMPGAQPGMDPMGMGQPGMDPMAQGGGMPQDPMAMGQPGMGQPGMGMDPSMLGQTGMGQPGMGMDPSMGMGQDPSMGMQQPQMPGAMMSEEAPSAMGIENQINPQFLQQAGMIHPDVFDAAAIANLSQSTAVKDLVGQYVPNLEQALDNIGRVMLSLWMKESELKTEVGNDTFVELEDNLRTTFKNLGDLVLKLNQNATIMKGRFEAENPVAG